MYSMHVVITCDVYMYNVSMIFSLLEWRSCCASIMGGPCVVVWEYWDTCTSTSLVWHYYMYRICWVTQCCCYTSCYAVYHLPCSLLPSLPPSSLLPSLSLSPQVEDKRQAAERKLISLQVKYDSLEKSHSTMKQQQRKMKVMLHTCTLILVPYKNRVHV